MSLKKLLHEAIARRVESGHYSAKGTARSKERHEELPKAMAMEQPKKPEPPAEKRKPGHEDFVRGMRARKLDEVGSKVESALDAKFKGKKK